MNWSFETPVAKRGRNSLTAATILLMVIIAQAPTAYGMEGCDYTDARGVRVIAQVPSVGDSGQKPEIGRVEEIWGVVQYWTAVSRPYIRLLKGTVGSSKHNCCGEFDDRDWNIFVKPDSGFEHLLVNSQGIPNGVGMPTLPSPLHFGEIELEIVSAAPWLGLDLATVYPPGKAIDACGWWVEDKGHSPITGWPAVNLAEGDLTGKTELHPIIFLKKELTETDGFFLFAGQDISKRFSTAYYDINLFVTLPVILRPSSRNLSTDTTDLGHPWHWSNRLALDYVAPMVHQQVTSTQESGTTGPSDPTKAGGRRTNVPQGEEPAQEPAQVEDTVLYDFVENTPSNFKPYQSTLETIRDAYLLTYKLHLKPAYFYTTGVMPLLRGFFEQGHNSLLQDSVTVRKGTSSGKGYLELAGDIRLRHTNGTPFAANFSYWNYGITGAPDPIKTPAARESVRFRTVYSPVLHHFRHSWAVDVDASSRPADWQPGIRSTPDQSGLRDENVEYYVEQRWFSIEPSEVDLKVRPFDTVPIPAAALKKLVAGLRQEELASRPQDSLLGHLGWSDVHQHAAELLLRPGNSIQVTERYVHKTVAASKRQWFVDAYYGDSSAIDCSILLPDMASRRCPGFEIKMQSDRHIQVIWDYENGTLSPGQHVALRITYVLDTDAGEQAQSSVELKRPKLLYGGLAQKGATSAEAGGVILPTKTGPVFFTQQDLVVGLAAERLRRKLSLSQRVGENEILKGLREAHALPLEIYKLDREMTEKGQAALRAYKKLRAYKDLDPKSASVLIEVVSEGRMYGSRLGLKQGQAIEELLPLDAKTTKKSGPSRP